MSYQNTLTVAAGGSPQKLAMGGYVYAIVRSINAPVEISFDGEVWQPARQNDSYGPLTDAKDIYFRASGGLDCTVTFAVSLTKLSAQDTAVSNAQHFAQGNLGIATGAAAAGGLPACDANGFLQVTNAMQLAVSGMNKSHRRQILTVSVSANSPAALNILDVNGANFRTLQAGQDIAIVTDADFVFSGAGGTAWVSLGQLFLTN